MASMLRSLAAALAALATVSGACAQSVEEFYKKTQLSVYVGSGAGGGFDEIARVFSVHFARRLPGQPGVIVKNMPGAGGLLNVNFIFPFLIKRNIFFVKKFAFFHIGKSITHKRSIRICHFIF